MSALIELEDIRLKGPDGASIFEGARLRLHSGERVVIFGPVGAGKSAFLKMVTGLTRPSSGRVVVFGKDMGRLNQEEMNRVRRRLGVVFRENILISNLKVIENVSLPLLYHLGMSWDDAMMMAKSLLTYAGYRDDVWAMPGGLPMYKKRMVAIARAMALEPDIFICENLSEGLTEGEVDGLLRLLLKFHSMEKNRLLVVTTGSKADINLIKPMRVIRIEDGRFVEVSTNR